jgi:predicted RNA-binding protein YlxR (DUF448 family)
MVLATEAWAQTSSSQATAELQMAQINQTYLASEMEAASKTLNEAQEHLTRQQELYARGLVARRTLEEAQVAVWNQELLLDLLTQQKALADRFVGLAEENVKLAQQRDAQRAHANVQRVTKHYGRGAWTAKDFQELAQAFRQQFNRSLPISALGQTRTHRRLRFNHIHRMDIAIHPDDPEGQWLMDYLQENDIPFTAFRSSVPGQATGPHIHVGLPSSRY